MPLVPAKCPQCGGNIEVDNSNEAGICKFCGTPFVTEKAINNYNNTMINNININSSGNTVNILESNNKLEEYLQLARMAKENDDIEKAEKFYTLVLEAQPDSWEANFYSTYYSVAQTKIGEIPVTALKFRNSLGIVIALLSKEDNSPNIKKDIIEIKNRIFSICTLLYNNYRAYFLRFRINAEICRSYNMAVLAITGILYNFGDLLEKHFKNNNEYLKISCESYKKALEIRKIFLGDTPVYCNSGTGDTKESVQEELNKYSEKIKKFAPSFATPQAKGCYIATCVYGSYDCPQVWTLRRFRDYTLDKTWYGRLFIKLYYAISPTLVKIFGRTEWFKSLWKKSLDKMVTYLKGRGVADTQYKDKY